MAAVFMLMSSDCIPIARPASGDWSWREAQSPLDVQSSPALHDIFARDRPTAMRITKIKNGSASAAVFTLILSE
jgi:hypothetical protein